jgi:hypothetical protein
VLERDGDAARSPISPPAPATAQEPDVPRSPESAGSPDRETLRSPDAAYEPAPDRLHAQGARTPSPAPHEPELDHSAPRLELSQHAPRLSLLAAHDGADDLFSFAGAFGTDRVQQGPAGDRAIRVERAELGAEPTQADARAAKSARAVVVAPAAVRADAANAPAPPSHPAATLAPAAAAAAAASPCSPGTPWSVYSPSQLLGEDPVAVTMVATSKPPSVPVAVPKPVAASPPRHSAPISPADNHSRGELDRQFEGEHTHAENTHPAPEDAPCSLAPEWCTLHNVYHALPDADAPVSASSSRRSSFEAPAYDYRRLTLNGEGAARLLGAEDAQSPADATPLSPVAAQSIVRESAERGIVSPVDASAVSSPVEQPAPRNSVRYLALSSSSDVSDGHTRRRPPCLQAQFSSWNRARPSVFRPPLATRPPPPVARARCSPRRASRRRPGPSACPRLCSTPRRIHPRVRYRPSRGSPWMHRMRSVTPTCWLVCRRS